MRPAKMMQCVGLLLCSLLPGCGPPAQSEEGVPRFGIRAVGMDEAAGTSRAVVVDEALPLAHTALMLPVTAAGDVVAPGDVPAQVEQVVAHLGRALEAAGTSLRHIVKLNVYAADDEAAEQVRAYLAARALSDVAPAVTFMSGTLAHPAARVALDAVAAMPGEPPAGAVQPRHVDGLPGAPGRSHVAVLPRGGRVYLSGQAADAADLAAATRGTMEGLHATLAYLGLHAADVVQVKAFLHPGDGAYADAAARVEEEIAAYYRDKPAPPIVAVEWTSTWRPIEIELIAHRRTADAAAAAAPAHPIDYITPAGMTGSTAFSRVVEVRRGDLVYVSGLTGDPAHDAGAQVTALFTTLDETLREAGADFSHVAKATYYYATRAARSALSEQRKAYYDPERPPAASLIATRGTGYAGAQLILDMIGVVRDGGAARR